MANAKMHHRLRAMCDLAIVLGTIDTDREALIKEAEKKMYAAKTNEEALVYVDEIMALKNERSDAVVSSLELELLDRVRH